MKKLFYNYKNYKQEIEDAIILLKNKQKILFKKVDKNKKKKNTRNIKVYFMKKRSKKIGNN